LPELGRVTSPASIATVSVPAAFTWSPARVLPANVDRSLVSPYLNPVKTSAPPASTSTSVAGMPWIKWMRAAS